MKSPTSEQIPNIEWLTLAMVGLNYGAWFAILKLYTTMPAVSVILLGLCLAMQLSLQHELIHGHPTRHGRFNDLLGSPPITLIYPYQEYKRSHLAHHQDEVLTVPESDPESFFRTAEQWRTTSPAMRAIHWANMTLLGRLLINPVWSAARMSRLGWRRLRSGTASDRMEWLAHIGGIILVLWLAGAVFGMPFWAYLVSVHLGHALINLRSFYEHRIADEPAKRIVIVESCRFFRLLYLCNNFHAIHHRYPGLPWYRIENRYRAQRAAVLRDNGRFLFRGYSDWLRFLVRPIASPVHPARLAAPGT